MAKKKESAKVIPPAEYRLNQETYDLIQSLLDSSLRDHGIEAREPVNAVLAGITRVEPDEE